MRGSLQRSVKSIILIYFEQNAQQDNYYETSTAPRVMISHVVCGMQQQMQGQQHLPALAAHLPSLPGLPHAAAAAAAAAAAGINAGGAAGLMSMAAAGRLPSSSGGHMHSGGSASAGLKEEKGLFSHSRLKSQNLPFSQILPTIDLFYPSGLTPQTLDSNHFF